MASRNEILDAVVARLASVAGVVTCGRRIKLPNEVPHKLQPAIFLHCHGEMRTNGKPRPKRTLQCDAFVYVSSSDAEGPGRRLHALLDALEASISLQANESHSHGPMTTLGGLVEQVNIASVETDEGAFDSQAVAVVGLEIVLP